MEILIAIFLGVVFITSILYVTGYISNRHKRKVQEVYESITSSSTPETLTFQYSGEETAKTLMLKLKSLFQSYPAEQIIIAENVIVLDERGISWCKNSKTEESILWSDIKKVKVQENVWFMQEGLISKTIELHTALKELYFDETMGDYKAFRNYVLSKISKSVVTFSL
jgi:hypothetical protein